MGRSSVSGSALLVWVAFASSLVGRNLLMGAKQISKSTPILLMVRLNSVLRYVKYQVGLLVGGM
jgi:hypothetical protein